MCSKFVVMACGLAMGGVSAAASAQTPIVLWDMDPTGGNQPATLDLRVSPGQGVVIGKAPVAPWEDHLTIFNLLDGDMNGSFDEYRSRAEVAPVSMYNASNPLVSGGALPSSASYDAAALFNTTGSLLFEQSQYGNEFSLQGSFTVEVFFKTDGNQEGEDRMQILYQSEGPFRFGMVLNEAAPGAITFAVRDGMDRFGAAVIDTQNYADGEWHYAIGRFDNVNKVLTLSVTVEDGLGESVSEELPEDFTLSANPDGANLLIGRFKFPIEDPQDRTFVGAIDDIQITAGLVSTTNRLGNLPAGDAPDRGPAAEEGVVARWSMNPIDRPGVVFVQRDVAISRDARGPQDLWSFNALPAIDDSIFRTSGDVPPAVLFANGNDGGASSYDASALDGVEGAVFYPQDVYGNVFSFTGSFTVEAFIKTDGDQSEAGTMQVLNQGEAFFRWGVIMNEAGPGSVRFAINDGEGTIATADLAENNYADGSWHYVLAEYDADAGLNGELRLTVTSADGAGGVSTDTVTVAVDGLFIGLPEGNDGNLFLGRLDFPVTVDSRTFLGLIDEVQISQGVLPASERLGATGAGGPVCVADWNADDAVNIFDILDFLADWNAMAPRADVDDSGAIDIFDILNFLGQWNAGCP